MFFKKKVKKSQEVQPVKSTSLISEHKPIIGTIEDVLDNIILYSGNPSDLIIHRFTNGDNLIMALIYLDSLADSSLIGFQIIEPVNKYIREESKLLKPDTVELLISTSVISKISDMHNVMESLLAGQTIIILPNEDKVLGVNLPGYPHRPLEESISEKTVRGNREGLTEDLGDNLSLIRRWIKDPNLRIESRIIGERTKTKIAILYLFDVANPDTVKEVNKRLEK